ncbi:unnamed protein product, partial [Meganyctiphanes norvegica]
VNSTSLSSNDSHQYFIPSDVLGVLQLRYHVVLPIIVAAGILTNSFCLVIVNSPKLQNIHINIYFKFMTVVDLVAFIAHIPLLIDTEFCVYSNVIWTTYMTYLGITIPYTLRICNSCVLLIISYDRILAAWFHSKFLQVKHQRVAMRRLSILVIFITVTFIPILACGRVFHVNERWVSIPGFKIQLENVWFKIYRKCVLYLSAVAPILLIVGLNVGLIIAVIKKEFHGNRTRNRSFFLTVAVLVVNVTYSFCTIPYIVWASLYEIDDGNCNGTYNTEFVMMILYC